MKLKDNRLSVKEAADFIGVHTNTIYDWINDGRLIADKEGKSYKINHMSVVDMYSARSIVDGDKQVIVGINKVKESVLSDLRFSAGRTFQQMRNAIDKFEEFYKDHNDVLISDTIEFSRVLKEEPHNLAETAKRNMDSLYKPYDIQHDLILNLKDEIDKHMELYNFMLSLDNFQRQKKSNESTVDDILNLQKFAMSFAQEDGVEE
ncbi:MAG: helix-turn-helix domain-containing protein [Paraclostridium sp.]